MFIRILLVLSAISLFGNVRSANACEEYVNLGVEELKSLRDKLSEADADPIDRLFAFQQLVCSSNPTMRTFAVREGLKASSDQLVREQIVLDAFMQKDRIEVEMNAGPSATADDKEFIKKHSGIWVRYIALRSPADGCLGLAKYKNNCLTSDRVMLRGGKIELIYDTLVGEFHLTDNNELVGYVRVAADVRYSRIPAILKLN